MVLGYTFEPGDIVIVLTLIVLEGILSFDNAAVLAAMVRKLPEEQRKKALLYGLGGAYVFRVAAILGVVWIIRYPVLKLVGGLYLVYLAVKHLFFHDREDDRPSFLERFGVSGFWSVVIAVELADLVFALDQVLVAVAMTDKLLLIIIASLTAIVFLRISAGYMARIMDWFPGLERLAYVAVGLVGLKLVVEDIVHRIGYESFHVPKVLSVGVTFSLLVLPPVLKFLYERLTNRPASG